MSENKNWERHHQKDHFGEGNEHANAFGQPEYNKYLAHDERPYQTGNVSWEGQPNHKGKGPMGYKRSNERVQDEVYHILTDDDMIDATEIEVSISDGEVILNGWVNDRNERRRAEDVIDRINGVDHVQNNLRIRKEQSTPESRPKSANIDEAERNSAGTTGLRNIEVM